MHLTDEQVHQLADRQFPEEVGRAWERHAAQCPECQARLEIVRRETAEILARLRMVDHPLPGLSAQAVIHRAGRQRWGLPRWAAAVLLTFGLAGVAYAAPGSPVPAWIRTLVARIAPAPEPAGIPVPPPPPVVPPSAGIAVYPGERLAILFQFGDQHGSARIALTEGSAVVVRAASGAAGFTAGAEQVVVEGRADTSRFEVQIPRAAARVEVLLRGRQIFLKAGDRIVTSVAPGADGSYLLSLDP